MTPEHVAEVVATLRTLRLVPRGRAMRVVVRMTSERNVRRTALRDEIQRWMLAPPGREDRPATELWAVQVDDQLRLGIRLPHSLHVADSDPHRALRPVDHTPYAICHPLSLR